MSFFRKYKNALIVIFILVAIIISLQAGKAKGIEPYFNPYANTPRIALYEPSYQPVPYQTFDNTEFIPFVDKATPSPKALKLEVKKAPSKLKAVTPVVRFTSNGWRWPVRGRITSRFSGGHLGIDIAGDCGTSIRAAKAGKVTFAGWNSFGGGRDVKISHGNGYSSDYAHLSAYIVHRGQYVAKGQRIGYRGQTGNATGCHLHFAMKRNGYFVNPLRYLP